jgi:uncharacterized protein (UPF0548 family)
VKVPASIRPQLEALSQKSFNYDARALDLRHPGPEWHVDDRWQPLPSEPPGEPLADGSWAVARRLIQGYDVADPAIVRAFYEQDEPYPGRDMLLELRALGFIRVRVGVRISDVYDESRVLGGREGRVYGWAYRTLEGHVESGQMHWEVWKWTQTGDVGFRVHSVSRPASGTNPVIRIGFWLLRGHERALFLRRADRRMVELTQRGLRHAASPAR